MTLNADGSNNDIIFQSNGTTKATLDQAGLLTATSFAGNGANLTSVPIADNAITLAKMASGTDGNIISYDASGNPVAIATGSDGQVLTSTGAGSAPAFESLPAAAGVPTGVIAMWHGNANAIPSGWVACDGNNSTPNLVDKFIKSKAAAGSTGGSATTASHTLAISEMPSHTHGVMSSYSGTHDVNSYIVVGGNRGGQVMKYTEGKGGDGGHTHGQSEPIFFALIFIMKT